MRLLTGHSPEQIGGAFNCPASSLNAHPLSVVLVQRRRNHSPLLYIYIYTSEFVFAYLMQMKWRVFFVFIFMKMERVREKKRNSEMQHKRVFTLQQQKENNKTKWRWLMDEIDDGWARRTTCPTPPLFFLLVRRAPFLPAHVLYKLTQTHTSGPFRKKTGMMAPKL